MAFGIDTKTVDQMAQNEERVRLRGARFDAMSMAIDVYVKHWEDMNDEKLLVLANKIFEYVEGNASAASTEAEG
jgi:hypothetical protein